MTNTLSNLDGTLNSLPRTIFTEIGTLNELHETIILYLYATGSIHTPTQTVIFKFARLITIWYLSDFIFIIAGRQKMLLLAPPRRMTPPLVYSCLLRSLICISFSTNEIYDCSLCKPLYRKEISPYAGIKINIFY
jgi:hypothetical protein